MQRAFLNDDKLMDRSEEAVIEDEKSNQKMISH